MTLIRTVRRLTIFGAATLVLASVTLCQAQAAPASGMPTFGSVDIAKVQSQSTRKTKYDAELHALADRLDTQFRQRRPA